MQLNATKTVDNLRYDMKVETPTGADGYFSVTGDINRRAKNHRWIFMAGGCIHDDIQQQFPWAAPLIALHLSDEHGVPMHAVENAWYWAGGTRWNGKGPSNPPNAVHLSSHLRIDIEVAEGMVEAVLAGKLDKPGLEALVDKLRPRWAREAQAAIKLVEERIAPAVPAVDEDTSPRPR